MSHTPICPMCQSEYIYQDGALFICPECAHEWASESEENTTVDFPISKDAYGTPLQNGDSATLIKDLKVKGSSHVVKVGTKIKNIKLVSDSDYNIDCKIDGIGAMKLKSEFVKKISK